MHDIQYAISVLFQSLLVSAVLGVCFQITHSVTMHDIDLVIDASSTFL